MREEITLLFQSLVSYLDYNALLLDEVSVLSIQVDLIFHSDTAQRIKANSFPWLHLGFENDFKSLSAGHFKRELGSLYEAIIKLWYQKKFSERLSPPWHLPRNGIT